MTPDADARINALNRINAVLETLTPESVRRVVKALAIKHHIEVKDIDKEGR